MRKANKKISLNRETLRNLANGDLSDVIGGAATTGGTTRGVSCEIRCPATANTCITHCGCPSINMQNCTVIC